MFYFEMNQPYFTNLSTYFVTVILMMNPVLDQAPHQALTQAPVLALPAAEAVSQEAVTQEAAQTLVASRILTHKNPSRRWNCQISQTLMELR